MTLRVSLEYDPDTECPINEDGWALYSFNRNHFNFRDPGGRLRMSYSPALDSGLAFLLGYFEHGDCVWSLKGQGPQCRFDSVQVGGILIWEGDVDSLGPTSKKERAVDAARFLEVYTQWANGETYYYSIARLTKCGTCFHESALLCLDSCGGFIGADHLFGVLREQLAGLIDSADEPIEFVGDCASLAQYHWSPWPGVDGGK